MVDIDCDPINVSRGQPVPRQPVPLASAGLRWALPGSAAAGLTAAEAVAPAAVSGGEGRARSPARCR